MLTDPACKDALDTIAGSGRHLLLINDLLDQCETGSFRAEPGPRATARIVGRDAAMVRIEAQQKVELRPRRATYSANAGPGG
jgi:hypothetical protein